MSCIHETNSMHACCCDGSGTYIGQAVMPDDAHCGLQQQCRKHAYSRHVAKTHATLLHTPLDVCKGLIAPTVRHLMSSAYLCCRGAACHSYRAFARPGSGGSGCWQGSPHWSDPAYLRAQVCHPCVLTLGPPLPSAPTPSPLNINCVSPHYYLLCTMPPSRSNAVLAAPLHDVLM